MLNKSTVSIVYDFDDTLAQGNLQDNSFIPALGISTDEFWQGVWDTAKKYHMDQILAYMYYLVKLASKKKTCLITKRDFFHHGSTVRYFEGVEEWFPRMNKYAQEKQLNLEHYIISSGIKEMIEGTSIAKQFKSIYASSFKYNEQSVVEWPSVAINYTTKVQYLFRINKGILNVWDDNKINEYIPHHQRPILFENMIYIGDGLTDVPTMKMLNHKGGVSIGVYSGEQSKHKVQKLLEQERVTYIAKADYTKGQVLDIIVKNILAQISFQRDILPFSKNGYNK